MVDSNLYQVDKKIALEMDISVLNEYERVFKSIDKDKDEGKTKEPGGTSVSFDEKQNP